MPDMLHEAMTAHMWTFYLCIALAPFVQEDAATVAAASLAASGMADPMAVSLVFLAGLSVSDLWKYGIGRAAHSNCWARKMANRDAVTKARVSLEGALARTIFTVRFIPGLRIATYIAAGFFRIPFVPFALLVIASAILLYVIVYSLFWALGMALGEAVRVWLPIIGLGIGVVYLAYSALRRLMASKTAAASHDRS